MSAPTERGVLAVADARKAGVERVIYTLMTMAKDACRDDDAKAYVDDLARESCSAVAGLLQKCRAVTATGDERTLQIAIDDLRAALSRAGGE